MPVHFAAVTPVLIVDAVEPTRSFFVDRLGFAVLTDIAHDGALGLSTLRRGQVTVMVQSESSLRADTGENYVPGPYKASIWIDVDDVEAFIPEIADADVVLPPRRSASGVHEVGVREPGGNIIIFTSRPAA